MGKREQIKQRALAQRRFEKTAQCPNCRREMSERTLWSEVAFLRPCL